MIEIWKTIPGFSLYQASTLGNLKTFNWKNKGVERIMKPAKDASGYLRTVLINDKGKHCTIKVHRIIATTFLENPENKKQVNHKDADKSNNRVDNLEWCTFTENIRHSIDNNLMVPHPGEKNGFSKLTEKQVLEIRAKFRKRIYTREMLGQEYGVKPSCIKDVVTRKSWKHI